MIKMREKVVNNPQVNFRNENDFFFLSFFSFFNNSKNKMNDETQMMNR